MSIDIDVLDAIYAPATSTPAVNVPSPDQIKALLRMIGAHADVRGIDIVEVNPLVDQSVVTQVQVNQLLTVALAAVMARRQAGASIQPVESSDWRIPCVSR